MPTVKELRAEAKNQLKAGNTRLKGYSSMSKSKLLSALGRTDEARNTKSKQTLSQRANSAAKSVAGDSEAKRASLKGRILRSVKREIDSARKANPDINQEELRKVAASALGKELKAIKEGKPEPNRRKEAAQKRKKPLDSVSITRDTKINSREGKRMKLTKTEQYLMSKLEENEDGVYSVDSGYSQTGHMGPLRSFGAREKNAVNSLVKKGLVEVISARRSVFYPRNEMSVHQTETVFRKAVKK